MTRITPYGGCGEIGGNQILLEQDETRTWLDFGLNFNQMNQYFDEFMQPRKCNGILDLQEFDLLPEIKGLYRKDYQRHCRQKPTTEPKFNAVLLSHAHMDHAAYVHYLRKDIPIHCSTGTYCILKALDETGSSGTTELVRHKKTFCTYTNTQGKQSKLQGKKAREKRPYEINQERKKEIGNIEIQPYPVSHSLPGATAYGIQAGGKKIVYTGDYRLHGYRKNKTEKFIEEIAKQQIDVLITEGTRVETEEKDSEKQVYEKSLQKIEDTENLAVVNYPARDTDRMQTFHEIAKKTDRSLVVNLKQAYLLDQFEEKGIQAPRTSDSNIRIYIPRKSWGLINDPRYPERLQKIEYSVWERPYLEHDNAVTAKEIRNNQESYIFRCDFFELKELIDIRPGKNSSYIRSKCEPFNLEMQLDQKKVNNWLKHFNLYPYEKAHASGHLNRNELEWVLEKVEPEKIIPVHTEHPRYFKQMHPNVEIPEKGKPISI